jgi:hypothetical protein
LKREVHEAPRSDSAEVSEFFVTFVHLVFQDVRAQAKIYLMISDLVPNPVLGPLLSRVSTLSVLAIEKPVS